MLVLIALAGVLPVPSAGWAADNAVSALQLGMGTRSFGLGRAFTAVADDPSAVQWNPSGLTQLSRPQVLLAYSDRFGLGIQDQQLGFALPVRDRVCLAIAFVRASVGDIKRSSGLDENGRPRIEGTFDDAANVGILGAGVRVHEMVSVGASVKYYYLRLDQSSAHGFGLDLGAMLHPTNYLTFGLAATDVTKSRISWNTTTSQEDVAARNIRFGSVVHLLDRHLLLTGEVAHSTVDDFSLHAGAEYWLFENLALRAGVSESRVLAGCGLRYNRLQLDYAFDSQDLGDTHRLSLMIGI
jgi:opacity protein-like surface antigen